MPNAKVWMFTALVLAVVIGTALIVTSGPTAQAVEDRHAMKHHWRYFDGHWSYWEPDDSRWYYTDGQNWFYYDDGTWKLYRFDKRYGREGFEREGYRVPSDGRRIVVPRHRVYIQRR
jgi:hypothetical protein